MESLTLQAGGLTFDAVADGPGHGRTVLLLHGFPQTSLEWNGVMPALAEAGYRTVAPDQRGYSRGARPESVEAYSMASLVGDVVGFADALGAERIDLVGHDWGSAVAFQTAARHPERVRSLTGVSVPHPLAMSQAMANDPEQRSRSGYIQVFREDGGVAERALTADDWKNLRAIYQGKVTDEVIEHYVETLSAEGALTAALNWYRAIGSADLEGLEPVSVPTLFVWSTGDAAIGRTAAEANADFVTGPYRFVEFEGVTHWVPDEEPGRLSSEILDHLSST